MNAQQTICPLDASGAYQWQRHTTISNSICARYVLFISTEVDSSYGGPDWVISA